ncbi:MAG: hypothetical protein SynsKO_36950 [Synoicihabitans sp.]
MLRPNPFRPVCLLACLSGMAVATATAAWTPQVDVGYVRNDNVSNSIRAEREDEAITAAVDFSSLRVVNRDWQSNITVGADTTAWRKFSGLNLSQFHATFGLRRKFGLGPYATKLDLRAQGFHQEAKTSPWSGQGYEVTAAVQKRFSPAFSGSLTGALKRFDSRRAVYSGTHATLTAAISYDLTPDWRFSASVFYRDGDQLSWCKESFPEFAGQGPQWRDGIFGGDWFPYQSEGHTRGANLGIARALGDRSAASVNWGTSESRAPKGHVYRNEIVSFNLTHAF